MILLFCIVIGVFLAATYDVVYHSFVREVRAGFDDRLLDIAKPMIAQMQAHPDFVHIGDIELHGQTMELLDESGIVVESSRGGEKLDAELFPLPKGPAPSFKMVHLEENELRAVIVPIQVQGHAAWFVIAQSTKRIDRIEASFRERAFGLWTVSLLFTTLIAAWYVGRSLEPIVALSRHAAQLTEKASRVSREDIDVGLPISNPNDELGILASNFNVLFARVGAVVRQLRQFVSDAAHELRTPLSVVRGETQFLLSQPRSPAEYEGILRTIDGELTVMVHMIEGLFTLSMADAGQLRLAHEPVFLNELLEEACGLAAARARRKNIRIERMQISEIELPGDAALIRQVFLILIENATKYSPANTTVRVGLTRKLDHAEAVVRDEGFGIAPEHLPHIFKRFYRAAPQTEDETRSGGLGLAIAEAIMRAANGDIRCESEIGRGSTFILGFPLARDVPDSNQVSF